MFNTVVFQGKPDNLTDQLMRCAARLGSIRRSPFIGGIRRLATDPPSQSGSGTPKNVAKTSEKHAQEPSRIAAVGDYLYSWLPSASSAPALEKMPAKHRMRLKNASKHALRTQTRALIEKLQYATSPSSLLVRCEELNNFLMQNPESTMYIEPGKVVQYLLKLKRKTRDLELRTRIDQVLAQVGYTTRPVGWGLRILSLDGGGTRGLVILEVLDELQRQSGRKIHELFDYIVGVSTGAIIPALILASGRSVADCKKIYEDIAVDVFRRSRISGARSLLTDHSYYDTKRWVELLQQNVGAENIMLDLAGAGFPKVGFISAVVNRPTMEAFLFRNYNLPPSRPSIYRGAVKHKLWLAVQASGAAPGYFEELIIDDDVHQDGGILVNNPTGIGVHEAKLLWPDTPIQAVISVGSGRTLPSLHSDPPKPVYSSIQNKIAKIIDSASDTQMVHFLCNDLLDSATYFRFNPYLPEMYNLDENRPERLKSMQDSASLYCHKNSLKFKTAVMRLMEPRGVVRTMRDWVAETKDRYVFEVKRFLKR